MRNVLLEAVPPFQQPKLHFWRADHQEKGKQWLQRDASWDCRSFGSRGFHSACVTRLLLTRTGTADERPHTDYDHNWRHLALSVALRQAVVPDGPL